MLDIAIWFFNEIGENFDVRYGWAYGYQVRIAFLTKNDFFELQNFQQNTAHFVNGILLRKLTYERIESCSSVLSHAYM